MKFDTPNWLCTLTGVNVARVNKIQLGNLLSSQQKKCFNKSTISNKYQHRFWASTYWT